jgi:hypothetical protein
LLLYPDNSIIELISQHQARAFARPLSNENFVKRVENLLPSMMPDQAVVVAALEMNLPHLQSVESTQSVFVKPNSLRLLIYLFRADLLDAYVTQTDFSGLSERDEQKAQENLLVFNEIRHLIDLDFSEEHFLKVHEKCQEQMPIIHSGITAILTKITQYKFSENGIKWSQEILKNSNEVEYLKEIGIYRELICRIQEFYLPELPLDNSIEKIHLEFGQSLTNPNFVYLIGDCFRAGLSFPRSAITASLTTLGFNIFKYENSFGDLLDNKFFDFFDLFNFLYKSKILANHAVIIASVVKRTSFVPIYNQYEIAENILNSANEVTILKKTHFKNKSLLDVFVDILQELDLPLSLKKLIEHKFSQSAPEIIPTPQPTPQAAPPPQPRPPAPMAAPPPRIMGYFAFILFVLIL